MSRAYASTVLAAPVPEVWRHLRDFGALEAYYPITEVLEVDRPGDQVGCSCFNSAEIPAICGVAIDVPDMVVVDSGGVNVPATMASCIAWSAGYDVAARRFTPGAAMSGFSRFAFSKLGPRDEKSAT